MWIIILFSQMAMANNCKQLQSKYEKMAAALKANCQSSSECMSSTLGWDTSIPLAVNMKADLQKALNQRTEWYKICPHEIKLTTKEKDLVYCVKKRCDYQTDLIKKYKNIQMTITGSKKGKISIALDGGEKCIAPECTEEIVYTTDLKNGRFTLPLHTLIDKVGDKIFYVHIGDKSSMPLHKENIMEKLPGPITLELH